MKLKFQNLIIDIRFNGFTIGCIYVTLDNHTYYIDNSTNEQIFEKFDKSEFMDS